MQGPQNSLHASPALETVQLVGRDIQGGNITNECSLRSTSERDGGNVAADEDRSLRMHELKSLRDESSSVDEAAPAFDVSASTDSLHFEIKGRASESWLSRFSPRWLHVKGANDSRASGRSQNAEQNYAARSQQDALGVVGQDELFSTPRDLDMLATPKASLVDDAAAAQFAAQFAAAENKGGQNPAREHLWKTARKRLKATQALAESVNERAMYGCRPPKPLSDIFQNLSDQPIAFCLDPRGAFRLYWDLLMTLIIAYIALVVPFRTAFVHHRYLPWSGVFVVELLMDIIFWIDILLNFHTPYLDESLGYFEYNRRAICINYLKTWFPVDLIACMPVDYILLKLDNDDNSDVGSGRLARLLRVIRLLKLTKLLRLVRLRALMRRFEEDLFLHMRSIHIVKSIMLMLLMGHLLGCLFYLFSKPEYQANWERNDVHKQLAWWWTEEGWANATHNSMDRNYSDIIYAERYIVSIYWAFTTICTVGYGDIAANTNAERVVSVVTMLLGGFIFSMLIGSMTSYFRESNAVVAAVSRKKELIHEYLRFRRFNRGFRQRVKDFYERLHKSSQAYDEQAILLELPLGLRMAVMEEMYSKALKRLPLFQNQDRFFVARFCLGMRFTSALPGDLIMEAGDREHCMYLLFKGTVEVWRYLSNPATVSYSKDPEHLLGILKAVSYFGEGGVLGYPYRNYSIKSANFCEIGVIEEGYISRLLTDFPAARPHMMRCLRRRLRQWEMEDEIANDGTRMRPTHADTPKEGNRPAHGFNQYVIPPVFMAATQPPAGGSLNEGIEAAGGGGGGVFDVAPYQGEEPGQMHPAQYQRYYTPSDELTAHLSQREDEPKLQFQGNWRHTLSGLFKQQMPPPSQVAEAEKHSPKTTDNTPTPVPPVIGNSRQELGPRTSDDKLQLWALPVKFISAISSAVDSTGHNASHTLASKRVSWLESGDANKDEGSQAAPAARDLDRLVQRISDDGVDPDGIAQGVAGLTQGPRDTSWQHATDAQSASSDQRSRQSREESNRVVPLPLDIGSSRVRKQGSRDLNCGVELDKSSSGASWNARDLPPHDYLPFGSGQVNSRGLPHSSGGKCAGCEDLTHQVLGLSQQVETLSSDLRAFVQTQQTAMTELLSVLKTLQADGRPAAQAPKIDGTELAAPVKAPTAVVEPL